MINKDGKEFLEEATATTSLISKEEMEHEIQNWEMDEAKLEQDLVMTKDKLKDLKDKLKLFK